MSEVVKFPKKFTDRLKGLFPKKKPSEPTITLNREQILGLFAKSSLYHELRDYKDNSNMVECMFNYDSSGHVESITFTVFNKDERAAYEEGK